MSEESANRSDDELEALAERLRTWEATDARGLLAFLKAHWAYADWGWSEEDAMDEDFHRPFTRYRISTAGWSDNEFLIDALRGNHMFWMFYWYSHRRGGHFEFRVHP